MNDTILDFGFAIFDLEAGLRPEARNTHDCDPYAGLLSGRIANRKSQI
jgi:hypothetical protein